MTCAHCCGAESIFDKGEAEKKLKNYYKKGPKKTTQYLVNVFKEKGIENLSLLDIGGGIGVIPNELFESGLAKATSVDASNAYISVSRKMLAKNGFDKKTQFIYGDFNDCFNQIEIHDVVTLERVVCCYPFVEDLLKNSLSKAGKFYAIVYPMDGFMSKLVNELGHLYLKLKKNPFRTFIHSEKMMNRTIVESGFKKIYYGKVFPWRIAVYERNLL